MDQEKSNPFVIPGAIVIAGIIIAGGIYFSQNPPSAAVKDLNNGQTPTPAGQQNLPDAEITVGNMPLLGDENAPITIVEFSDYQCPFCEKYFSETQPQIKAKYIDTGKAAFAYRDFAFLNSFVSVPDEESESHLAAQAARCANEQGKFWQFHDYIFNHQNGENQGAFSSANLKKFAAALGLNQANFNSCLDSGKYLEQVQNDTQEGQKAGVSGTPAFFIGKGRTLAIDPNVVRSELASGNSVIKLDNGNVVIIGSQPFSEFDEILQEMLK